ncbi:TIGR00282 family metallophosphoesterase [Fructilactobacillus vespulae]|uniref:TIGR00282 family metallophosphoesterase n=1 Tax=Fructilactobacillus vespulae TaxID=1249630 RepID=UPI0039B4F9A6
MRLLFVGDVVGNLGMKMVEQYLPLLKKDLKPQVTIVNGENVTKVGRGINEKLFKQLMNAGADVVTLGNHAWNNEEIFSFIDDTKKLIRPLNYPGKDVPGNGYCQLNVNGTQVAIINLQGRIFMEETDDPFAEIDRLVEQLKKDQVKVIFVDMHAETTSEKKAMALYLDGKISALVGTHTHVQTSDAHVLNKGTAFLTDVGMTGPDDGVIGMEYEPVIKRFLTSRPSRFTVEENGSKVLSACLIDVDNQTGLAKAIKPILICKEHPYVG